MHGGEGINITVDGKEGVKDRTGDARLRGGTHVSEADRSLRSRSRTSSMTARTRGVGGYAFSSLVRDLFQTHRQYMQVPQATLRTFKTLRGCSSSSSSSLSTYPSCPSELGGGLAKFPPNNLSGGGLGAFFTSAWCCAYACPGGGLEYPGGGAPGPPLGPAACASSTYPP